MLNDVWLYQISLLRIKAWFCLINDSNKLCVVHFNDAKVLSHKRLEEYIVHFNDAKSF